MPDKKPTGLLILHGFTGSLDTVRSMVPEAEKHGWPWRMPLLRGHGTRYQDMDGVSYDDWVADAEAALDELLGEVEKVVVVGLSMGGLVALTLGHRRPQAIAGLVVCAPALRFRDPLAALTPLIKRIVRYWDSPNGFADPSCAARSTNYKKFPTAAFHQLLDFAWETEKRLAQIQVPVVGLFATRDTIVHGIVPQLLRNKLGAPLRIEMFQRSGHEMLQDCEAEQVARAAMEAALAFARTESASQTA
ncbi:MAG: alpha/beta fold hydrolase [Candidatus Sericytochromatia bacterium]|nr:alpha/beta fold hydrolase [Candidatus Sericytochromatia bacterium]